MCKHSIHIYRTPSMCQILCPVLEKNREIKQSHCSQISHNLDCEAGQEEISTQRNDGYEEIPLKTPFMWQKFKSCRTYPFQKRKGS